MSFSSIGDLARSFQLSNHNARLRTALDSLTDELASGRKANMAQAVRGNFGPLAAMDRSLKLLGHFRTAISEAGLRASMMGTALDKVHDDAAAMARDLTTAGLQGGSVEVSTVAKAAHESFSGAVSALNTRAAGQSLFAGRATSAAALAPAETILADLRGLTAAATSAAAVSGIVDTYFNTSGGGFETTGYLGDTTPAPALRLGEGTTIDIGTTALDPALRTTLAGLAKGALLDAGLPALGQKERGLLARETGNALFGAEAGMVTLRSRLGVAERLVESAATANESEATALEISRSEITDSNPFRTAADLQSVTARLETLFALTARISRLSLTNFLR